MRRQIAGAAAAVLLLAAGVGLPLPAAAQDALALFERFIEKPAGTLQFVQRNYDNGGNFLEEVRGGLAYQRPGKFRLQYDAPSHPLIVSDGETVWLYESDLRQVIVTPADAVHKHGLWQVLAYGDAAELRQRYVLAAGVGGEVRWLTATARNDGETLREIALGFGAGDGALQAVRITDGFGGTAEMDVTEVSAGVEGVEFNFVPPPGVDVVEGVK